MPDPSHPANLPSQTQGAPGVPDDTVELAARFLDLWHLNLARWAEDWPIMTAPPFDPPPQLEPKPEPKPEKTP